MTPFASRQASSKKSYGEVPYQQNELEIPEKEMESPEDCL